MPGPTLITTADGSHSLRDDRLGITYHSHHGAIQESRHVFIDAGLRPLLVPAPASIHILELGLGTGLNALLTRALAVDHPEVAFHYRAFEPYPVGPEQWPSLNYSAILDLPANWLDGLHESDWETAQPLGNNFSFTKTRKSIIDAEPVSLPPADLLYYDAFAPEDQPELWSLAAMERAAVLLRPGGVLVTYCAKGQVKRDLRAAGFRVTALPGPPGKREITRAYRI